MQCPTCPGHLIPENMAAVEVDRCDACGGVWFDMGELERVHTARKGKGKLKLSLEQTSASLNCPRCNMATLQAVAAEGIPARWCEFCRGLFLSRESMKAVKTTRTLGAAGVAGTAVGDGVVDGAVGVAGGAVDVGGGAADLAEGAADAAGGAVEVAGSVLGTLFELIDFG